MSRTQKKTITDKIIEAEVEFFKKGVRDASYLIITPYVYTELLQEMGLSISDNICHYMGLTLAIVPDPDCLGLDNEIIIL